MLDSIPGLMNAIRMINSYSRYYNTSDRMTALFVKVTNQMINASRAHITDNGYHKVKNISLQKERGISILSCEGVGIGKARCNSEDGRLFET